MKKRNKTKKLSLSRLTIRPLDSMEHVQGAASNVSLGNTRCSVTEGPTSNGDVGNCMETL